MVHAMIFGIPPCGPGIRWLLQASTSVEIGDAAT